MEDCAATTPSSWGGGADPAASGIGGREGLEGGKVYGAPAGYNRVTVGTTPAGWVFRSAGVRDKPLRAWQRQASSENRVHVAGPTRPQAAVHVYCRGHPGRRL